jgi:hypothetical protein
MAPARTAALVISEDAMFQLRLASLPAWVLVILIVGGVATLALLGMIAVRRLIPHTVRREHNDVAGFMVAVVGVIYAVLLALVVIAVWDQFEAARTITEHEANAIANLYRGADGFADADRDRLRTHLQAYTQIVIDDEWPLLGQGLASDRAWQALDEIWRDYLTLNPQNSRESEVYAKALDQLDELGNARRVRLLASRTTIPPVLWLTLLAGGGITIGFSYFFGTENERAHALMTVSLAVLIGLGLYVIVAMDAPFTGGVAISPEAFQQSLAIFEQVNR